MSEALNIEFNESIHAKCKFCAEVILKEAKKCKHCGEFQDSNIEDLKNKTHNTNTIIIQNKPSNGIAALIAVFIVGGGHIYKGRVGKGFLAMLFIYPLLFIPLINIFLGIPFYIANIIDAYNLETDLELEEAKRLKEEKRLAKLKITNDIKSSNEKAEKQSTSTSIPSDAKGDGTEFIQIAPILEGNRGARQVITPKNLSTKKSTMFKITIVAIMLLTASTALVIYKRQQELNTPVIVLMGDDYKAVCRQIYNSEIDHKIHTTFKSFDECNTSKKKDFMQYEFNRQIEENLREQKKQHIVLKAPEAKVSATQNACEKLWSDDGKAYYYCPKNMTPEELGVNIKQFAENNYSKSRGMALIHIFNNKKLAPTSDGSFKYVPDKVLDKILVGMFTYIQDNHYMEFNCMRAGATDLSDCTNLVPKTEFVIPN